MRTSLEKAGLRRKAPSRKKVAERILQRWSNRSRERDREEDPRDVESAKCSPSKSAGFSSSISLLICEIKHVATTVTYYMVNNYYIYIYM